MITMERKSTIPSEFKQRIKTENWNRCKKKAAMNKIKEKKLSPLTSKLEREIKWVPQSAVFGFL